MLSLLLACGPPPPPPPPPAPATVTVATSATKINSGGTATLTLTAADATGAPPNPGVVVWTNGAAACGSVPPVATQPGTDATGKATETFTGAAVTQNCPTTITATVSNGGGDASGTVDVTVLPPTVSAPFSSGGVATGDTLTVKPLNASPPLWTYELMSAPTPMTGVNVRSTDPTCVLSSVTQTTPPASAPTPAPTGALPSTFAFSAPAVSAQVTLSCDGAAGGTTTFNATLGSGAVAGPVAAAGSL